MMMVAVPMMPMLDSSHSNPTNQSNWVGNSGSALPPVMTVSPVYSACSAGQNSRCIAFPTLLQQQPQMVWQPMPQWQQSGLQQGKVSPTAISELQPERSASSTFTLNLQEVKEKLDMVAQALRHGDPVALRSILECILAPDAVVSWPELGTEIRGRDEVIAHSLRALKNIPDLEYISDDIVLEGDLTVRVSQHVVGKACQSDPTTPYFRTGQNVCKPVSTVLTFDKNGLIKERKVTLVLPSTSTVEKSIFDAILDNALPLAATFSGSWILQHVIDNAELASLTRLAEQFQSRVVDASACPHANHILQKLIVRMPPERILFIATEMKGHAAEAAQHRTQGRILERLIEHFPPSYMESLLEEVISCAASLCRNAYGNFIVQSILEHGTEDQCARVAATVLEDVHRLAKHKFGSNVVRTALAHSPCEQRDLLVDSLTADPRTFSALSHHRIGSFVAREAKAAKSARSQLVG